MPVATARERVHTDSIELTTLIGRDGEIERVAALLRSDDVRLLTVTGPGGVGKTRLAQAAAESVADDFEDVVHVPLQAVDDPDRVVPTVSSALGLLDGDDDPLTELVAHLVDRESLLVLDNFEQVLPAATALVTVVQECPSVTIAVTSRTRLRVSGEQEWPLGPLDSDSSVALFVERARAVAPGVEFDSAAQATIAEICGHLDGLPLAIELAASRAKLLSLEAMEARLERRLELLTDGPRDAPDRQRTLRSTIAWSVDLLTERETDQFLRLAVFVGGWTLEAAEIVCGAELDVLGALVDMNLVRADGDRFTMLETVREYALELLEESGQRRRVEREHALYYAAWADTAAGHLQGPQAAEWSRRLEKDLENLRASLRRSLDEAETDTTLQLCNALWRFWLEHGYLSEGRDWLDQALGSSGGDTSARASVLTRAGMLALYQGDYEHAERLCTAALQTFRNTPERVGAAGALTGLGLLARNRGSYDEATGILEEALAAYDEADDQEGVARTLDRLGITAWLSSDDDRAQSLIEDSLRQFRNRSDVAGAALALQDLAMVAVGRGDLAAASELLDECHALLRELGDRRNAAKALWTSGDLSSEQGNQEAAAEYLEESLRLMIEFGDRWFTGLGLERAATVAMAAGDPERAGRLFGAAQAVWETISAPLPLRFRARHDALLESARAELGDERFAAAFDAGLRLRPQDAVDLVRHAAAPAAGAHDSLTPREIEVLALIATGLTDADVAEKLVVSLRTVHAHLRSIYRKLDVHSRSAATRYAVEHGISA